MCVLSVIFLCLTACGEDQKKESDVIEKISDIPVQYKRELGCLNFDIEHVKINTDTALYQSSAKIVEFDPKIVAECFFGESYQESICENEEGIIYLTYGQKTVFLYEDEMIYLSNSELQSNVQKNFSLSKNENGTAFVHSNTVFKEPLLQAEKNRLEKQIQEMGIQNLAFRKYFDLDNCIYWLGIQECQGIPVFTTIYYEGMDDEWMPVQILNTLGGLEKMEVLYCFQFEQGEERIQLLSFDQIAEGLRSEYDMILADNRYDVVGAELFFWVNVNQEELEYKMEPVWVFTVHEYCKEDESYNEYQEMIHAQTGKSVEVRE